MSKIAIIGLGYVGLPLAYEFSKVHDCRGFDISKKRILELKKGIDETEFRKPDCPIYQNFTGNPEQDPLKIKINLLRQLTGAVLWNQSIKKMIKNGVKEFYEVGPGNTLQGLIRKIDRNIAVDKI